MTKCAVLFCKSYSDQAVGISFHQFPTDPSRKREWVKAVRREKAWIPKKHTSVCSFHFEPECFTNSKKQKKLFKDAVPTLNLPEFSHENKKYISISEDDLAKNEGTDHKPSTPVNLPTPLSNAIEVKDSPRNQRLNQTIQKKNRKIKRIQHQNRQLKKKVADLEEILDNLVNKTVSTDEDKILLEKIGGKTKYLIKLVHNKNQ